MSPTARALPAAHRLRLWIAVWLNLALHVSLDAFNTYGVHPFFPFDSRWFYGDAVFIFEPWLWLLLGIAAIGNARGRLSRNALGALVIALVGAVGALRVVPGPVVILLATVGAALAIGSNYVTSRVRSAIALAASALFLFGMFGLSRVARAEVLAAVAEDRRGELVDVVLSPDPAVPVCWTVIVLEEDAAGNLASRRGTVSIAPSLEAPSSCVSRRFMRGATTDRPSVQAVAWSDETREPLASLRHLYEQDCWVRAWLQFGRAPVLRDGRIMDLRFDTGPRGNFTAMPVSPERADAGCPAHVTSWGLPRADVLGSAR